MAGEEDFGVMQEVSGEGCQNCGPPSGDGLIPCEPRAQRGPWF